MEDLFSSSSSFSATYEEVVVPLPAGVSVRVRESNFHVHNANRVWPGTAVLAAWLAAHPRAWIGKRVLELGAATGILAIFLTKIVRDPAWARENGVEVQAANVRANVRANGEDLNGNGDDLHAPENAVNALIPVEVLTPALVPVESPVPAPVPGVQALALQLTTSDYADDEIADAIKYNFALNALADATPPHWPHTWGTPLPADLPRFEVVIANDILIYVKQYPNLVATLLALLRHAASPDACVILSCQRRIGQAERDFLDMLEAAGARYTVVGPKIYRIVLA